MPSINKNHFGDRLFETIRKKENLWELLFQDESQGLFETEEAAERHAEILLKEC